MACQLAGREAVVEGLSVPTMAGSDPPSGKSRDYSPGVVSVLDKVAGSLFQSDKPVVGVRGIHLDLKGVPPTADRLLTLLDLCAAARLNAVLVEWEDMFPWTCDRRFRCETAYTPDEVRSFAARASALGIEIIPLVQCLGHMETPLKFPEYAHLREVPEQSGVLNPLAPGARELVQSMVDDVLELLPDVEHFHLGGDEAWSFGTHPDTKAYIEKHGKGALYMQHVEPLLDHLLARGIRPILWHDMMVEWDDSSLDHLKEKADLCVWGYQAHPDSVNPRAHYHVSNIERFGRHGVAMWGGTAYKGADGADSELPNIARRVANEMAWTEVAVRFGMKGVLATAWSRYSTMITQVEPIDASLDSLVLAAAIMHDGQAPADWEAACREFLQGIGEWETFQSCRASMAELARQKHAAWDRVRQIRQNMACMALDSSRSDSSPVRKALEGLKWQVGNVEKQAPELISPFAGLVPSVWMERLVGDRIEALKQEVCEMERALS